LDRANEDNDRKLADHVLQVHQKGCVPAHETEHAPLLPEQLRTYVAMAKQHEPKIPEDLTEYVSAIYAELRRQEAMSERPNSYTTPRTLLSILRLSQALAKLRFDNSVCPGCDMSLVDSEDSGLPLYPRRDAWTAVFMSV
jgi:DNA replication licensing factor MCM7